eukprot:9467627-Pyramimonas_sp.AAC.1
MAEPRILQFDLCVDQQMLELGWAARSVHIHAAGQARPAPFGHGDARAALEARLGLASGGAHV